MSIVLFTLATVFYTISQLQIQGKLRCKKYFWAQGSWEMKYAIGMPMAPSSLYYRLFKIKYKERFPGSATIFVSLTDGYHLMQLFFKVSIVCSILLYKTYYGLFVDGLGLFILFGVVFTIVYRLLSNKL